MYYAPFAEEFREIAERETRTIAVPEGSPLDLPPDEYGLLETFCNEPGCDCRRVMFQVYSRFAQRLEAVVAWGWESPAFYRRWLGGGDDEDIRELKGPALNVGSPATPLAAPLLGFIRDHVLTDVRFVERVKRHYRMYKRRIDERARGAHDRSPALSGPGEVLRGGKAIPRNSPCPCGSGKKYKHCCLRSGGGR